MTNGVLMFALNGQALDSNKNKIKIDYVTMAIANAKNIKKHMKNNLVALITNLEGKEQIEQSGSMSKYFDHIIITNPKSYGKGPETNIKVNKRSMRVGTNLAMPTYLF